MIKKLNADYKTYQNISDSYQDDKEIMRLAKCIYDKMMPQLETMIHNMLCNCATLTKSVREYGYQYPEWIQNYDSHVGVKSYLLEQKLNKLNI